MDSWVLYTVLIAAFAVERLWEVRLSLRNARRAIEAGGREYGRGHYPAMVALHTLFLVACPLEVWLLERAFVPWIGGPMLAVSLATQGLRYWVITTLGWRWNTRVIVVPGLPLVAGGPFQWIRHPNYVAVCLELFALPLVHGAWLTSLVFSALNAALLWVRIGVENQALGYREGGAGGGSEG